MARSPLRPRARRQSYTVVIERDPDSGWLVGEVVQLPGCYTQAADLPALDVNIKEAIRAYRRANRRGVRGPEYVGTWQIEVGA